MQGECPTAALKNSCCSHSKSDSNAPRPARVPIPPANSAFRGAPLLASMLSARFVAAAGEAFDVEVLLVRGWMGSIFGGLATRFMGAKGEPSNW